MTLLAALAGCALDLPLDDEVPDPEPPPTWTVNDLWDRLPERASVVTVDVVITSPRTASGTAFFAQQPGGGPRSGLLVQIQGVVDDWPPEIGTLATLTGPVDYTPEGPLLTLTNNDRGEILAGPEAPAVAIWPASDMGFGLVGVHDVTVTSRPDPGGIADTDGSLYLAATFGVTPPDFGNVGQAGGILIGRTLSLRRHADWRGTVDPYTPEAVSLPVLQDLPSGTPVRVDGLVQATPWSPGGRHAVLQDETGRGVWVDAEGWGVAGSDLGTVASWTGEVRFDGEGLRLRVWDDPVATGSRDPVQVAVLVDGAWVTVKVTGATGPDIYGAWQTREGWILDDRFLPLDDVPDPATVHAAVRLVDDEVRLAVVELGP